MGATISILRRELGAYFNTPIGYVIIAAFLALSSWFYVSGLFLNGTADMRGFFGMLPLLFLFFIPAISMRLWAEERKLGTMELLMTMPIKTWQAVVGKYLAGLVFMIVMLALSLHQPIALFMLGNPDFGHILAGYFGAIVLGMVYLAVGAFASSLTSDQIVALILGIVFSLVFFLMGQDQVLAMIKDWSPAVAGVVERFGVGYHFESITRGVLDTRDVIYAVSVTGMFLFFNVMVIERRR